MDQQIVFAATSLTAIAIVAFATLRGWPVRVAVVDMAWGAALTGLAALAGYLAVRATAVRQLMADARTRHHAWIREHGTDLPEVAEWSWNA